MDQKSKIKQVRELTRRPSKNNRKNFRGNLGSFKTVNPVSKFSLISSPSSEPVRSSPQKDKRKVRMTIYNLSKSRQSQYHDVKSDYRDNLLKISDICDIKTPRVETLKYIKPGVLNLNTVFSVPLIYTALANSPKRVSLLEVEEKNSNHDDLNMDKSIINESCPLAEKREIVSSAESIQLLELTAQLKEMREEMRKQAYDFQKTLKQQALKYESQIDTLKSVIDKLTLAKQDCVAEQQCASTPDLQDQSTVTVCEVNTPIVSIEKPIIRKETKREFFDSLKLKQSKVKTLDVLPSTSKEAARKADEAKLDDHFPSITAKKRVTISPTVEIKTDNVVTVKNTLGSNKIKFEKPQPKPKIGKGKLKTSDIMKFYQYDADRMIEFKRVLLETKVSPKMTYSSHMRKSGIPDQKIVYNPDIRVPKGVPKNSYCKRLARDGAESASMFASQTILEIHRRQFYSLQNKWKAAFGKEVNPFLVAYRIHSKLVSDADVFDQYDQYKNWETKAKLYAGANSMRKWC